MNEQTTKPWYKSWTIWTNVGFAALSLLAEPTVSALLPPKYQIAVAAAANLLLRAKTDSGVTISNQNSDQDSSFNASK